ncbi:MAG: DEAD/DEAH box helicase, partial [Xenococcaceae cyanobacterium MO_234.B1]|nr:DEAD/DEAH box helicase [Xenococcaceae cyanobacterium MO_234.B1]
MITLTESQALALEKLKQFVNSNEKYFRLTGYAGTGKSFTIAQFMQWLQEQNINFVAGSPTNKAVKNLVKLASENNITIEAHTVAQLLGQQPELDETTGKEEFVTGDSKIGDYDLVILDEFSMISKSNFEDIAYEINGRDTKVIFVGDPAQLPPVGEKYPIVAKHPFIKSEANLDEVVRYDGSIAHIAEHIRSEILFNKILYPFSTTSDGSVTCMRREEWLQKAIAFFKSEDYQANPDHVRFLVWRNKTAAVLNNHVRTQLWGIDAPDYVPGDRLIAKMPVFRPNPHKTSQKNQWQIVINNSEECEVVGKATIGVDRTHQWEYWEVPVLAASRIKITLRILTPDSEEQRLEYLKELRKDRNWKKYYYWLKLYDNVPYSYAITTHKSQGSSINYIFLDLIDMGKCPDLQKILYTALTRA